MILGGLVDHSARRKMRSRRRCWSRSNGAEQREAPPGAGPVALGGILRA
jgi:hypothetical protein